MQQEGKSVQEHEQDFSEPWEQSDVVLLVEGQKIHVHRLMLSMCSPVFSRMFSAEFKEKDADEIPLPGKKATEIREMLLVIYPSFCKRVTDNNLDFLLPLAREYQMTVLTQKCEDYLLWGKEKKNEISSIMETLIVAQNFSLERLKTDCIKKTQNLSTEDIKSHELYDQLEPLSQRRMVELQMDNMEKKLSEAKAELEKSNAEISKLQGKIKEMKKMASEGLEFVGSIATNLGNHIRHAMQMNPRFQDFAMTKEQHLKTIQNDTSSRATFNGRDKVCLSLNGTYSPLVNLHYKLLAITKEFK